MVQAQASKGPLSSLCRTALLRDGVWQDRDGGSQEEGTFMVCASRKKDVGGTGGVSGRARELETGKGGAGKVLEVSRARLTSKQYRHFLHAVLCLAQGGASQGKAQVSSQP